MDIFSLAAHQMNIRANDHWLLIAAVAQELIDGEELHQTSVIDWAGADAFAVATDQRLIVAHADLVSGAARTIDIPYERIDGVNFIGRTVEIVIDVERLTLIGRDESLMVLARIVNAALADVVGNSIRWASVSDGQVRPFHRPTTCCNVGWSLWGPRPT